MVITNNYRTYERGRREEEEWGLRRRRSRADRAANNVLRAVSHAFIEAMPPAVIKEIIRRSFALYGATVCRASRGELSPATFAQLSSASGM